MKLAKFWSVLQFLVVVGTVLLLSYANVTDGARCAYADAGNVKNFITKTARDVTAIINLGDTEQNKADKLQKLFEKVVDIEWMGKFALAKSWGKFTPDEQNEYMINYKAYLVRLYIPRFKEYNDQVLNITDVKTLSNQQYLIMTQIILNNAGANSSGNSPGGIINVGYRCKEFDVNTILIRDIIGENISLINTQRSEFSSIIEKEGPTALITLLKSKSIK
ncbi:phospholipid transport system substrate-binding protein [Alphaproteobacteria bacterium]